MLRELERQRGLRSAGAAPRQVTATGAAGGGLHRGMEGEAGEEARLSVSPAGMETHSNNKPPGFLFGPPPGH